MTTITVIDEFGNEETIDLPSSRWGITIDGEQFTPAVATNVEITSPDESTAITDDCGNTERRTTKNTGWSINVEGIVTNVEGGGNLSIRKLKQVSTMDEVSIFSDVHSGVMSNPRVTITQVSDMSFVQTKDMSGKAMAFEFTFEAGDREADN